MMISRISAVFLLVSLAIPNSIQYVFDGCKGEADVVFLLDGSDDVDRHHFVLYKRLIRNLVSGLDIYSTKTRVGVSLVTSYGSEIVTLADFSDKQLLLTGIDEKTKRVGGTGDLGRSLGTLRQQQFSKSSGDRANVTDTLVLIGGERMDFSSANTRLHLKSLTDSGTTVIIIVHGYNNNKDRTMDAMLSKLATSSKHVFHVTDARDFDVRLTDIRISLCESIPACSGIADIAFMVDSSGSISLTQWNQIIEFVIKVVGNMYIAVDGVNIAFCTFDTVSRTHFGLQTYHSKEDTIKAIRKIPYTEGYGTNIAEALRLLNQEVFQGPKNRKSAEDIVILITDAKGTTQHDAVIENARILRNDGARVFAIGIGGEENYQHEVLAQIASSPVGEYVFDVEDFDSLDSIDDSLVMRTCRETPPICNLKIDLAIAVDTSYSMDKSEFKQVQNFIRELSTKLLIDSGKAKMAVLTFSDEPKSIFDFNTFNDKVALTHAIDHMTYLGGATNIAKMLKFAQENVFASGKGHRSGSRSVLVIVTDGASSNSDQDLLEVAKLKNRDITIVTIGVGHNVVDSHLKKLASYPSQSNYITATDYKNLFLKVDTVQENICDDKDNCISNPCQNGGICINGINSYACRCGNTKYTGIFCDISCKKASDLVIALDASGSIEKINFDKVQEFVNAITVSLNINHRIDIDSNSRIGLLTFATVATIKANLNTYQTSREFKNGISLQYTGGTTNTALALRTIRETMFTEANGDRKFIQNVILILTDGKSDDSSETMREALECKKAGIHIVVVGIGASKDDRELLAIGSDPDHSSVFIVKDFNDLTPHIGNMIGGICADNDQCVSNPCANEGECKDIINGYVCTCKSGFSGDRCQFHCNDKADIVFLVDSSGSIEPERFGKLRTLVKECVGNLSVADGNVNIGLIYYSKRAVVQQRLRDSAVLLDSLYDIDTMPFVGGSTNTASAMQLMRTDMFNGNGGDRPGVQNFAVIITDGVPNVARDQLINEAIRARISGVHIILATIGYGLTSGENYLRLQGIASEPMAANFFNSESYKNLTFLVNPILGAMCNSIDECKSNPCKNGGTCFNELSGYSCECREKYTGVDCSRQCTRRADVSVLMDVSGSVEDTFPLQMAVVKRLVDGLAFRFERTRLAYTTFADKPEIRFGFDNFTSRRDIANAISINEVGYGTDIAAALRSSAERVFAKSRGDRLLIDDIVVLISDGKSTLNTRDTLRQAEQLKGRGIRIYAVAVGSRGSAGVDSLNLLASQPSNVYASRADSVNTAVEAADKVLDGICGDWD